MSNDESIARALDEAGRHLPLPLVPPGQSRRLREILHTSLRIVPAELVTDTREQGVLVGARGGATSAWSMSFRSGVCDILLDLVPSRSAVRVSGQLLCPDPTADTVMRIFDGDNLVGAGSTDKHGQFELGDLGPAEYAIAATRPDHVIEILLDLRPQADP